RSLLMSIFGSGNWMPQLAASRASVSTRAACSSALDGMHPRYRHTPPGLGSGSIKVTFMPRSAARNAAAYPPGPPPITASCVVFALSLIVFPVAPMTPTLALAYALAGFLSIRLTYRVVRTTLVYDPSTHTHSPRRDQIGRASCRERVWVAV